MDWILSAVTFTVNALQVCVSLHYFTKLLGKPLKWVRFILCAAASSALLSIPECTVFLQFALLILFLCIIGRFVCKRTLSIAALYAVVVAEIMSLMFGIFNSLLTLLFPLTGPSSDPIVGFAFMLFGDLAILGAALCYRLLIRTLPCHDSVEDKGVLIALVPSLLICTITQYISTAFYGDTLLTSDNELIPAAQMVAFRAYDSATISAGNWQLLGIQLLSLASLFCVLYAYRKLREYLVLAGRISLLEQEEKYLRQYVAESKARYDRARSFRHDVNNHLAVLAGLLAKEKTAQAAQYLEDLEGVSSALSFPCNTNNPVLDVLIADKLGIARKAGVDASCTLQIPDACSVSDIDLVVIVSNALDNALNACQDMPDKIQRYICIGSKVQGQFLLINVENSAPRGRVVQVGTGLENIETVANKYDGALTVRMQQDTFYLSVLLRMPLNGSNHPD